MAAAQGPLPLPAFGGQGERARGCGAGGQVLPAFGGQEVRGAWLRRKARSPYPPSAGRGSGRVAAAQESRTMRLE